MTDVTQVPRAAVYARQSQGKTKSIADQEHACAADAEAQGWKLVGVYRDTTSASRYARRDRPDHGRLLADIAAGLIDVVVVWEPSRGDRTLASWAAFLELCRERKVLIRVTDHGRTYDMNEPRDWRSMAEDGVDSGYEAEKLSRRVRRGVASAARNGRPPMGPAPYGYRRVYDPASGRLTGQEPDPTTAPIVREIFARVVRCEPLSEIVRVLNERGDVPPPGVASHATGSRQWYRMRVRNIVLNPAYAGLRKHKGQTYPGGWEPLVTPETYHTAQRVMNQPDRLAKARPGRQRHLLTWLATCYRGHPLVGAKVKYYSCHQGCVSAHRGRLDALVEATVVEALADPRWYGQLRQAGELTDAEAQAARDEAATLEARLSQWRQAARRGEVTPATMAEIEAGLAADIAAARGRAERAGLPPALRPFLEPGADVEARWAEAHLIAKREVIRALMTVTVHPCPGRNSYTPLAQRVTITPRA